MYNASHYKCCLVEAVCSRLSAGLLHQICCWRAIIIRNYPFVAWVTVPAWSLQTGSGQGTAHMAGIWRALAACASATADIQHVASLHLLARYATWCTDPAQAPPSFPDVQQYSISTAYCTPVLNQSGVYATYACHAGAPLICWQMCNSSSSPGSSPAVAWRQQSQQQQQPPAAVATQHSQQDYNNKLDKRVYCQREYMRTQAYGT